MGNALTFQMTNVPIHACMQAHTHTHTPTHFCSISHVVYCCRTHTDSSLLSTHTLPHLQPNTYMPISIHKTGKKYRTLEYRKTQPWVVVSTPICMKFTLNDQHLFMKDEHITHERQKFPSLQSNAMLRHYGKDQMIICKDT